MEKKATMNLFWSCSCRNQRGKQVENVHARTNKLGEGEGIAKSKKELKDLFTKCISRKVKGSKSLWPNQLWHFCNRIGPEQWLVHDSEP